MHFIPREASINQILAYPTYTYSFYSVMQKKIQRPPSAAKRWQNRWRQARDELVTSQTVFFRRFPGRRARPPYLAARRISLLLSSQLFLQGYGEATVHQTQGTRWVLLLLS